MFWLRGTDNFENGGVILIWNEIIITTTGEASDAVSEMLNTIGAAGVAIFDPQDILNEINSKGSLDYADPEFIANLGEDTIIKAYFPGTQNPEELKSLIGEKLSFISRFINIGKGEIETKTIDEEDWANAWKKYYNAFNITPGILIKPSWQDIDDTSSKMIIELDPGMAFGTGTHETTKMCAEMVEKYAKLGNEVFDVGTGSGILAIVSAKIGAGRILACDIDEVAVRVAKENATINGVEEKINIFGGVIEDYSGPKFDIVIANIIANVIIQIAPYVLRNLKQKGLFIASGIIRDRREEVLERYQSLGFELVDIQELGEWVAIVLRCPDSL